MLTRATGKHSNMNVETKIPLELTHYIVLLVGQIPSEQILLELFPWIRLYDHIVTYNDISMDNEFLRLMRFWNRIREIVQES